MKLTVRQLERKCASNSAATYRAREESARGGNPQVRHLECCPEGIRQVAESSELPAVGPTWGEWCRSGKQTAEFLTCVNARKTGFTGWQTVVQFEAFGNSFGESL